MSSSWIARIWKLDRLPNRSLLAFRRRNGATGQPRTFGKSFRDSPGGVGKKILLKTSPVAE